MREKFIPKKLLLASVLALTSAGSVEARPSGPDAVGGGYRGSSHELFTPSEGRTGEESNNKINGVTQLFPGLDNARPLMSLEETNQKVEAIGVLPVGKEVKVEAINNTAVVAREIDLRDQLVFAGFVYPAGLMKSDELNIGNGALKKTARFAALPGGAVRAVWENNPAVNLQATEGNFTLGPDIKRDCESIGQESLRAAIDTCILHAYDFSGRKLDGVWLQLEPYSKEIQERAINAGMPTYEKTHPDFAGNWGYAFVNVGRWAENQIAQLKIELKLANPTKTEQEIRKMISDELTLRLGKILSEQNVFLPVGVCEKETSTPTSTSENASPTPNGSSSSTPDGRTPTPSGTNTPDSATATGTPYTDPYPPMETKTPTVTRTSTPTASSTGEIKTPTVTPSSTLRPGEKREIYLPKVLTINY